MGGGGFMQDAANKNRQQRAQRQARREKFNGNYSEHSILSGNEPEKIEFPELPAEQIEQERVRIQQLFLARKKRNIIIVSIGLIVFIIAVIATYNVTQGFEYW